MAKILLWATFFLSQETVCVHLGILLQSHIESYRLLLLWATFLLSQGNCLRTPWDTFAIPHRKLLPPLAAL